MEEIYKKLLKIGKELFDELPEEYEPERIEKCFMKYSSKSFSTFFNLSINHFLGNFFFNQILNQMSWKDVVNLVSKYLKELPGDDANKSFAYVVKNFFEYLK